MSRRAWVYIGFVLVSGFVLAGLYLAQPLPGAVAWFDFVTLTLLSTLAQLFKALLKSDQGSERGTTTYSIGLIILFAGLYLLPPALIVPFVIVPYLFDWLKERLTRSANLPAWYIQPFNIATHLIAAICARSIFTALLREGTGLIEPASILAALLGAAAYVLMNHALIGSALYLARGVRLRESGVFSLVNLTNDLIQLCLGYVVAVLWRLNPILIVPALSPLVTIYQALQIPQLKQDAQTDPKTGLWNARHFRQLFTAELERAGRFNRPAALVMSDLDLLRNVNNTYGHLAGDAVLAGVGRIIRDMVREFDIPARFGGEEFCIGLLEAGPEAADAFAERLRLAIASTPFDVPTSATPIHVTLSLGVACFPGDATSLDELVHQADVAVYQAKLNGRNRVAHASDAPHSARLEDAPAELDGAGRYAAAFAVRIEPAGAPEPAPAPEPETLPAGEVATRQRQQAWRLPLLVGGVIAAGALVTLIGFLLNPSPDLTALVVLVALATLAEAFQVKVYGMNTISASLAITFAAALTGGVPEAAAVSLAIVLVHYVQTRPALYKTVFNWATHVLAVALAGLAAEVWAMPLEIPDVLQLGAFTVVAGLAYYGVETGLIALAVGLSQQRDPRSIWREQFRWLAYHYLGLCLMGALLAVAYLEVGLLGAIVFALPVFMTRYSQKQYVDRTEESIRELRRMNQELARANREIVGASDEIRQLNDELFLTLARIIDARDPYAAGHAAQVSHYATSVASELGIPPERVERLRQAALVHDIGKLGIPEQFLHKTGQLTAEEYAYVKRHASLGAQFLEGSRGLRHLAPIIRHHHERWDGTGYPDGLRREDVPIEARILAVCDAVEAMASDRPYRRARPLSEILAELQRSSGTQFDPTVVAAFVRLARRDDAGLVKNSAEEVFRRRAASGDEPAWVFAGMYADSVSKA